MSGHLRQCCVHEFRFCIDEFLAACMASWSRGGPRVGVGLPVFKKASVSVCDLSLNSMMLRTGDGSQTRPLPTSVRQSGAATHLADVAAIAKERRKARVGKGPAGEGGGLGRGGGGRGCHHKGSRGAAVDL